MLGRIVLDNYACAFDLQPAQDPSVVIACMTRRLKSLPVAARGVLRLTTPLLVHNFLSLSLSLCMAPCCPRLKKSGEIKMEELALRISQVPGPS